MNPYGNIKTNVPNTNWNGSPSKNFKNRPTRGGFKGGYVILFFFVTLDHLHVFPRRYNCPISLDSRSLNLMM